MTNAEKNLAKMHIQLALKNEFGFSPNRNEIILLEASGDLTYIMFEVNDKQYQLNSYLINGDIIIGVGTITRYEN